MVILIRMIHHNDRRCTTKYKCILPYPRTPAGTLPTSVMENTNDPNTKRNHRLYTDRGKLRIPGCIITKKAA